VGGLKRPPIRYFTEVKRTEPQPKPTSAQTLSRFATRAQRLLGLQGAVSISITSNREMQGLNRRFRNHNKATDVLSFPSQTKGMAGDIAISLEIAASNAEALGHSLATEVKILILHGLLHLAGYDHEIDGGEMLAREAELRREFKLPVGLIERSHASSENADESVVGKPRTNKRRDRRA
jgi:probable rRNA maturation factor